MFALVCALVAVLATVCHTDPVTLTAAEKQSVLDAHNLLRSQIALGLTARQPEAANMAALEWDDRLEASASKWVSQCKVGRDSNEGDRAITGYTGVGQNWAGGKSSNYSSYVQMWFDEYKDYTYDGENCPLMTSQFTQVVWAKTTLIGCAAASCTENPKHFACNYATAGNVFGEKPYIKGPAGSQCLGDYSMKQKGLCLRKDQCTGSDCTCTRSSCASGATFDSANCKCVCPANLYGDKCENTCQNDPSAYCEAFDAGICGFPGYDVKCAKFCNLCKPAVSRDPNATNKDNVKFRAP